MFGGILPPCCRHSPRIGRFDGPRRLLPPPPRFLFGGGWTGTGHDGKNNIAATRRWEKESILETVLNTPRRTAVGASRGSVGA